MTKINFTEPNTVEWREWKKKCRVKTEELIELVRQAEEWEIEDALYKEQKDKYYKIFNGKCAYCEKKIEIPYESELDHFRPKRKVTYIDDTPVMINSQNDIINHPGYYWLAYDSQNLLLSCQLCNKPHNEEHLKLGKRNRFPLEDNNYAIKQGEEVHERPLLINPVKEDPQIHLEYNSKNGFLRDYNSIKGKTCIEIFGLNIRNDLVDGRKDAYEKVKSLLAKFAMATSKKERMKILQELKSIKKGEHSHSIAAISALKEYYSDMEPLWED